MLTTPLPSLNKRVTLTISWSRLIVYILLSRSLLKKKHDGKLPFLDILVERTELGFETRLYQKSTFSGQYIPWESFSPRKRKTNLIVTLVHRALICTKNKLKQEIHFIKKILLDNMYPEYVVLKHISKKIAQFSTARPFGPESVQCTLEPRG